MLIYYTLVLDNDKIVFKQKHLKKNNYSYKS